MLKKKSLFITFEGIEGSGKSYQSLKLYKSLKKKNIPVILTREPGGTRSAEKIREVILDDYFHPDSKEKFDTIKVVQKNEIFTSLDVWIGKKNKVEVISNQDYYLTIPKRKKKTIKAVLEYKGPIEAPIKKGDKLALLNVYVSGELKKQIDLFSTENIRRSNIFSRLLTSLNYLVWGDV